MTDQELFDDYAGRIGTGPHSPEAVTARAHQFADRTYVSRLLEMCCGTALVTDVAVDSCICGGGPVRRDCWAEEHR